jgi:hypothetical protein
VRQGGASVIRWKSLSDAPKFSATPRSVLGGMQPNTTRLSTKQAAEFLGLSEDTLRWWRHRGDRGPRSYALSAGNVVYDLADLQIWADERKAKTQRGEGLACRP